MVYELEPLRPKLTFIDLCKIDLLTCIQNLIKISLIVFELEALVSHVSWDGWKDGHSDGRTEKMSLRGAPLLKLSHRGALIPIRGYNL